MIAIRSGKPVTRPDARHRTGSWSSPALWQREGRLRHGFVMRALTLCRASQLDALIASGDEASAPELCGFRARQLLKPGCREAIAAQIEACVEMAGSVSRTSGRPTSVWLADLRAAEVHAVEAELLDLARQLRSSEPAQARGVAMAVRLVCDAESPLYGFRVPSDVPGAVHAARSALRGPVRPSAEPSG